MAINISQSGVLTMLLATLMFASVRYVECLECYECSSVKSEGSNDLVNSIFKGSSNPGCENPDEYSGVPSVTCPNGYEYKCGFTEATVTKNVWVGDLTMKIHVRDCYQTSLDNGCYTGDEDVKKVANAVLDWEYGLKVDGKVCYCDEDLCDAQCGDDSYMIQDWCVKKWQAVLLGITVLIAAGFILSCCCCCCCCCRCCRKDRTILVGTPGAAVVTSSVNYTPHTQQADGIRGLENPGYVLAAGTASPYTEMKQAV